MCRRAAFLLSALLAFSDGRAATLTSCDEISLRDAITRGGRIDFQCDGVIALSQTIVISHDVVLDGNGHSVTLSGGNSIRLFYVNTGSTLTLSNLVLANGFSPQNDHGGAVYTDGGSIMARECLFKNNRADLSGGAIFAQNSGVSLAYSTFVGNEAANGGALSCASGSLIEGCSFVSNNAAGAGGGLMLFGDTHRLVNSTFYGNRGSSGGALTDYSLLPVTVIHCTFVENSPGNNYLEAGASSSLTIKSSILADSSATIAIDGDRNLHGARENVGVGRLSSYGPVFCVPLLSGSLGIDAGNPSLCPVVDQRGVTRCDGLCDIGAFEFRRPGALRFSASSLTTVEGTNLTVEVMRAPGSIDGVSVDLLTRDLTALNGRDYAATNTTLTFDDCISNRTVIIPILNDSLVRSNRTFQLVLSNATLGASLAEPSTATVTIIDDDFYGGLSFTSGAFSVREGISLLSLPVLRTGGVSGTVSADYFCTAGTAGANDYVSSTGTVYFAQGQTSNHIDIALLDDSILDGNKTFWVSLANLKGGAVPGSWGATLVTIIDDENEIAFSSPSYHSLEGQIATIPIVRRGYLSNSTSIRLQTSDMTAIAGQDYFAIDQTVFFAPGQGTNFVPVGILSDAVEEPRELFRLILSNPAGALLGQPAIATFAIGDTEIVSVCDESSLREALMIGRKVIFNCDGAIRLSSTIELFRDTLLDGGDRNVRITGGRAFNVVTGANVTIKNISVVDCLAVGRAWNPLDPINGSPFPGYGGGIANFGRLSLVNCVLSNNTALAGSIANEGQGGAIYNYGDLSATNCIFVANACVGGWGALAGPGAAAGLGGAIYNAGTARIWNSLFETNYVRGGYGNPGQSLYAYGGAGASGFGGAIYSSGPLFIFRSSLRGNTAFGGDGGLGSANPQTLTGGGGGAGGLGAGGALYGFGTNLAIANCTFEANRANGGIAGDGGNGVGTTFGRAGSGGGGGSGGGAGGGAIYLLSTTASMTNSTFCSNAVFATDGGHGGNGGPGEYPRGDGGNGGSGGNGGNDFGADLRIEYGELLIVNNTFSRSFVTPGAGAPGGAGAGSMHFDPPGTPGATGVVGQVYGQSVSVANGSVALLNTIIEGNGSNSLCFGNIIDAGFNLCSSDTCSFTNTSSINNTDPLLSDLGQFGGSVKTMALLPGSPAANAGSPSAFPAEDQRGMPRPQAGRCDIGAVEAQALHLSRTPPGEFVLAFYGLSDQHFTLEASNDLIGWSIVRSGSSIQPALISVAVPFTPSARFFRVKFP